MLIFVLVIEASVQLNLVYQSSSEGCQAPFQATFNPTDNDLVAVGCQDGPNYILLYNISANTLNPIQNYSQSTASGIVGLKFLTVNSSRAVASVYSQSIQLFTLTPQAIYSEYTLSFSISTYNYNLDISPSGIQAVVAALNQIILYQIAQASINQVTSLQKFAYYCYGATYVSETIVLITCNTYGIYQFSIQQSTITYQKKISLPPNNYFGITFLTRSNTNGIYADYSQNFYNFTYSYNDASSTMSSGLQVKFPNNYTLSSAFSADNSRLILTGSNNISLYKQQQQEPDNGQHNGDGLPAWGIALIVIGSILFVLILAGLGLHCYRKSAQQEPADLTSQAGQQLIQQHDQQNGQQQ